MYCSTESCSQFKSVKDQPISLLDKLYNMQQLYTCLCDNWTLKFSLILVGKERERERGLHIATSVREGAPGCELASLT